jgi:hypothetical protein
MAPHCRRAGLMHAGSLYLTLNSHNTIFPRRVLSASLTVFYLG